MLEKLMISGAWKDASFKNYNFAAAGQLPEGGALHPLLKMREEMRQIFFDMGYVSLSIFPRSSLSPSLPITLKKVERKEKKWRISEMSFGANFQIH
jgi:hypothetical protein